MLFVHPCPPPLAHHRQNLNKRQHETLGPSALERIFREGDERKTTFSTASGHYEYLLMPYGPANAPWVFQAFINDVLRDMLGRYVKAYIDDILVYSPRMSTHGEPVVRRLMERRLYVKSEKYLFHQTSVFFLRYRSRPCEVEIEEDRVSAIKQWPIPSCSDSCDLLTSIAGSSTISAQWPCR